MLNRSSARNPLPPLWQRWEWLLLPILALPIVWLYVTQGLPKGHDVPNHLLRLMMFDQYLRAGMGYLRWLPDLALGYGYPLLNFYAPATYYLAWLWKVVVNDYQLAFMCTLMSMLLAGGWGTWILASDLFGEDPARFSRWQPLVAAVAFIYAPYLLTNIFVRGAIAEVGAQAWLPWVLLSFRRVMRFDRPLRAVPLAAVTLAGLAVTHSISLLLVPPFLLAYLAALSVGRFRRLGWAALACALAMGLSAFFWAPLILERGYLAPGAVDSARNWMSYNFWKWDTFVHLGFFFNYTFISPFQLGLVQILLAAAGFLARRVRQAEWWFLAGSAVLLSLLGFDFAQPFWNSSRELLIVQFPWRLLTITSLLLALLTAGLVSVFRGRVGRAVAGLILVSVIIVAHRPTLMWKPLTITQEYLTMPPDGGTLSPATVAQYESIVNDIGLSSNAYGVNSDFIPKWVNLRYGLRPQFGATEMLPSAPFRALAVEAASPFGVRLTYTADQPATLRLTNFYFPGWQARLEDGTALAPYPGTPIGLLTLAVPAGTHHLTVEWHNSTLEGAATLFSGLAWLVLTGLVWWALKRKRLAALPLGALAVGVVVFTLRPPLAPVVTAPADAQVAGLQLTGLRWQQRGTYLDLYPYWFVRTQAPDVELWWQLTDADGHVLTETRGRPYFDTVPAYSWPTGTLVDDAYRLGWPPGLPAGQYALRVCALPLGSPTTCDHWTSAGTLALPAAAPTPPAPALTPAPMQFGDALKLAGYTLIRNQTPLKPEAGAIVVHPGETINVTLYWQAQHLVAENYHSYVHLDGTGAAFDHTLGPFFYQPRLWDTFYLKPDPYSLSLPPDTPSGRYLLTTGVYRFADLQAVPVYSLDGRRQGDSFTLLALKVLNPPAAAPHHALNARLGGLAQVTGYDLEPETPTLHPGDTLTVTLYFKAQEAAPADYSRFIHLYSAALGLAAQADSQPQGGVNPTSAWLPGETVADKAVLTIAREASAGRYTLQIGLYNPQADNARLPLTDANGQPLLDNSLSLTDLTIER